MSKDAFVRRATGLVRPFGVVNTLVIAMGAINLGSGTLLVYSSSLAFAPSYNFVLSLFIAMIMNLFVVLAYSMITIIMPRSGGDYVFVSRSVSRTLGFANNFFWTVISILGIAWNSLFMAGTAVSASLAVGGSVPKRQLLDIAFGSCDPTPMDLHNRRRDNALHNGSHDRRGEVA